MSRTIDITPTWGEWANIYRIIAEGDEFNAEREQRADFAKAMDSAQALQDIRGTLTEAQAAIVSTTLTAELTKQGF